MHYSKFIISSIEAVYRDLEYEEDYKPFTVLGIAMTNTLAVQLGISFFSVFISVMANAYLNL